jgi:hypothetical protein
MLVKAAYIKDGIIYTGTRHAYILKTVPFGFLKHAESGFVTDTGEFVDRETAARIAFECRQVPTLKHTIYSEDLWDKDGNPYK